MLGISRWIARLCAALLALVVVTEASAQPLTERIIPPAYERTHEFLEYLKQTKDIGNSFDARDARRWDATQLLAFMAADGIATTDVNAGEKLVHYSPKQLRAAIKNRKGAAFQMLAHLGHIYAQPYIQYSELSFEPTGDGVVVHVANWYRLTFALQADKLQLVRIDYRQLEGE